MIDPQYATICQETGMLPGSSWAMAGRKNVIVIMGEVASEDGDVFVTNWYRVLHISVERADVFIDTMFVPYLVGLASTGGLERVG